RGGAVRTLTLDLSHFSAADLEGNPLARIGLAPFAGPPRVGRVTEGSPAAQVGLQTGDVVVEINGKAISSARELIDAVQRSAEQPLQFRVERDGRTFAVAITPARVRDAQGKEIGRIGAEIGERPQTVTVRYGPVESIELAIKRTWDTAIFSLRMLGKMIIGEASLKNLSGPLTIADYAGQTARLGLVEYLSFLALVSISLGVLNLLPIPLLDGGHLLYYAIEALKGSPPSEWLVQWGQRAGIGVLVLLTALALFNDLTRMLPRLLLLL
ncbi:MAG TPA: RIP metalloprotease RseP, partial [Burkholderiaceae bacterium]|nr:RIP metalloprotease RseP [Burkholderiaceae bacterium]